MRKLSLLFIIGYIVLLSSCARKRRNGIFKFSGTIVDAYNNQGIDSILVYIANEERNGMYRPYLNRTSPIDTTNSSGYFAVETEFKEKQCPYLVIYANRVGQYKRLEQIYQPNFDFFEYDHWDDIVFVKRYMENNEYANETIKLMRYGKLRLDIKKNPAIASDKVIIAYQQQNSFTITSDTTLYVRTTPNETNQFTCKRGETIIWNQDFTVGLKGDTLTANIQL